MPNTDAHYQNEKKRGKKGNTSAGGSKGFNSYLGATGGKLLGSSLKKRFTGNSDKKTDNNI